MDPWLYIVLLGGVVLVVGLLMPRGKQQADPQQSSVRSMEIALEQFMENMEAENGRMVELAAKVKQDLHASAKSNDERFRQLEIRCADLEQALARQTMSQAPVAYIQTDRITAAEQAALSQAAETFKPAAPIEAPMDILPEEADMEEEDPSLRGRYNELFSLYEAGKSIEAISKKLGMNKGEVQLILQLSKQEEKVHHE
ncbi:hypothetical protein FHS18_001472 [Paenibacillus phyllosphaerae]|uniref:Uncharacterized protein n=1 Tax=Paenibacillus phyllosphaerae TaxID=274593 RepID=A0A7W5FLN6_9BACL|nr:hypothetical protein [Paenibacillus phyllosphaerae]MBB3109420.1 hypothetical protein [Paenibacillus phyllosphaerae]